jgi:hypothetical protein
LEKEFAKVEDFNTAANLTVQHSYITMYINVLVLLVMGGHAYRQIDYICHSYLKPYCMGRKTAFFSVGI